MKNVFILLIFGWHAPPPCSGPVWLGYACVRARISVLMLNICHSSTLQTVEGSLVELYVSENCWLTEKVVILRWTCNNIYLISTPTKLIFIITSTEIVCKTFQIIRCCWVGGFSLNFGEIFQVKNELNYSIFGRKWWPVGFARMSVHDGACAMHFCCL